MKDDKHAIDDLFKNRLYDVESNVQSSSWNDISKKIKAKSSFSIKKWFYGLGAASTLILVSYFVYTNGKDAAPVSQEIHVAQQQNIPVVSDLAPVIQKEEKTTVQKTKEEDISKDFPLLKVIALDERKTVKLPDGSEVILNRNSNISYSTKFITDRTIYVSGEVYVHAIGTKEKKIIVITNLSQIEAFESSFIVKSDKSLTYDEIFVSTGQVDCKSLLANEDRIVIFAGNNAVIDKNSGFRQNAIDNINYNDWVTQKIRFNNTALKTVFETLEKYYNVSLKADNPEIMNCHFTGTFERNNINEILQVLSVSFNLSFNQKSREYILSGKGCK